jgi:hypothetical protein
LLAGLHVVVVDGDPDLGDHAHDEALLFDVVRLYSVRILKNLAYAILLVLVVVGMPHGQMRDASLPE